MNALAALIKRVEKLEAPIRRDEVRGFQLSMPGELWALSERFGRALEGSLDAAVAFTEALLPGSEFQINCYAGGDGDASVWIDHAEYDADAPKPAHALVLAALKARADSFPLAALSAKVSDGVLIAGPVALGGGA